MFRRTFLKGVTALAAPLAATLKPAPLESAETKEVLDLVHLYEQGIINEVTLNDSLSKIYESEASKLDDCWSGWMQCSGVVIENPVASSGDVFEHYNDYWHDYPVLKPLYECKL